MQSRNASKQVQKYLSRIQRTSFKSFSEMTGASSRSSPTGFLPSAVSSSLTLSINACTSRFPRPNGTSTRIPAETARFSDAGR